jgi:hypothetical protein
MAADIEWVTGVIRAGSKFSEHGDEYDFSCTINRRGDWAELIGGNGQVTPEIWREVKAALVAQGVTHAHWDRMNNAPRSIVATQKDQISVRPERRVGQPLDA